MTEAIKNSLSSAQTRIQVRPGQSIAIDINALNVKSLTAGDQLYWRLSPLDSGTAVSHFTGLNTEAQQGIGRSRASRRQLVGSIQISNGPNVLRWVADSAEIAAAGSRFQLELAHDRAFSKPAVAGIEILMETEIPTGSTVLKEDIKTYGAVALQPKSEHGAPEQGRLLQLSENTLLVVGKRTGELESVKGNAGKPAFFTQVISGQGDISKKQNWSVGERQVFSTFTDSPDALSIDQIQSTNGAAYWLVSLPRLDLPTISEQSDSSVDDPGTQTVLGRSLVDLYRIDAKNPRAVLIRSVDLGLPAGAEIKSFRTATSSGRLFAVFETVDRTNVSQWWLTHLNPDSSIATNPTRLDLTSSGVIDDVEMHSSPRGEVYLTWSTTDTESQNKISVQLAQINPSSGSVAWKREVANEPYGRVLSGIDVLALGEAAQQRLVVATTMASNTGLIGSQLELTVVDSNGQTLQHRDVLDAFLAQSSFNHLSYPRLTQIADGRVILSATAFAPTSGALPSEVFGLINQDLSNINTLTLYQEKHLAAGAAEFDFELIPLHGQSNAVAALSQSFDLSKPHLVNGLAFDIIDLDTQLADPDKYFKTYQPAAQQNSALISSDQTLGSANASLGQASDGTPWLTSFAVLGDYGNVIDKKNNLATEGAPANYVGQAIRNLKPDFIVSLGDDNYVEGKREWKDFNVGKNYAPYIYPYTMMAANSGDDGAMAIANSNYLKDEVPRVNWNRFYALPGNHDVGMSGGAGSMEASGRRDWSYDKYYKAALEDSKAKGAVVPIAGEYVKPNDILYYDYSYGTGWNIATLGKYKEGAMSPEYYDYIAHPVTANGAVLSNLANIYMVDRNNTAYGTDGYAYNQWKKDNVSQTMDPQAKALMAEAQKRRNDVPWQIFASHYQTYSSESLLSGKPDGKTPTMDLPYFTSGFDLVLGAHIHAYERFINKDSSGSEGIYVVNGTGGYNTVYTKLGVGADQLFSPVGWAPGYQAGSTGGFGFGWINMNANELEYTQKQVAFTGAYLGSWAIGADYIKGSSDLGSVIVRDVDKFILRKKTKSGMSTAIIGSDPEIGPEQLGSEADVERLDIVTDMRLDAADIYLTTYASSPTKSGANVRIEADSRRNALHLSGIGDHIEAQYAGLIIDAPQFTLDNGNDIISISDQVLDPFATTPGSAKVITTDMVAIDQSTPLQMHQQGDLLLTCPITALTWGLAPAALHNVVNAGAGNNNINGSKLNDFILSGAGRDVISSGGGTDLVAPGAGADEIDVTGGNVTIRLGAGDLDGATKTIRGWNSDDRLALTRDIRITGYGTDRLVLSSDRAGSKSTVLALTQATWSNQAILQSTPNQLWSAPAIGGGAVWINADGAQKIQLNANKVPTASLSFVLLQNAAGEVKDPISGALIRPGDTGYAAAALAANNQVSSAQLASLSQEVWLAPVITQADGSKLWSIPALNDNGQSRFSILGSNQFGFELGAGNSVDFADIIATMSPL
jgi:hypothetical protein